MSTTDLDPDRPEADRADGSSSPRPWSARRLFVEVLLVVGSAAAGYVVAGPTGALVAGAAVVAGRLPSDRPGAAVAMASCVLLAGAAIASVVEEVPGEGPTSLAFPLERELAGDLAAAAGVLLFAAIVSAALAERSPTPAPAPAPAVPRACRAWLLPVLTVGVGLVAFVVRLVAAPRALAPELDVVVASVAGGRTLVVDEVGLVAPAGPVLAALAPGGATGVLVAVGVLVVAATATLAGHGPPWRAGAGVGGSWARRPEAMLLAGGIAAVLPSLWLLDLPGALAALAVVSAVSAGDPRRSTTGRAVLAGSLAGLGVLARPDVAVLGPTLVAWLVLGPALAGRRPSRRHLRAAWATTLAWAGTLGCWSLVVHGQTGGWSPLVGAGPDVAVGRGVGASATLAVLALDVAVLGAAALALRPIRRRLASALPFVVLPVWAIGVELVGGGDPAQLLSWGAPLVVVLASWQLAAWSPTWGRAVATGQVRARSSS